MPRSAADTETSPPVAARSPEPAATPGPHAQAARYGKVSIVIPVYRGARTIGPLFDRLLEEIGPRCDLEVVLVNDGSPDDSARVCRELAEQHPSTIRFLDLARNFGEHNAVMAGLRYCTGDCAVVMDDDFQNPPTEIIKLIEKQQEGYDVVYSYYEKKKDGVLRNLGSWFTNAVANVMIRKPRDLYLSSFKLLNRFLIDEVTRYRGPYPYIDGLILRTTRSVGKVCVQHDPRQEGRSGYTVRKLVRLWLNMFTNFSILPLRVASVIGFVFALLGLVLATYFAIERIGDPNAQAGWASLMCAILIVAGVQLAALGVIGEYLGRLFLKDNGSPQFVVRHAVNCDRGERD